MTVFASSLEETDISSSPKRTRLKAKTVPLPKTVTPVIGDTLSFLLSDGVGSKKRGCATISSVTAVKVPPKTFVVPMKIGSKDVMSILQEEEEVIFSGRKALLDEFQSSSIAIRTIEELKAQKNVCAIVRRREKENDPQRIGKQSTPKKVIFAEYDVFGGDEKISLDVVLKVEFIKVKKTKRLKE